MININNVYYYLNSANQIRPDSGSDAELAESRKSIGNYFFTLSDALHAKNFKKAEYNLINKARLLAGEDFPGLADTETPKWIIAEDHVSECFKVVEWSHIDFGNKIIFKSQQDAAQVIKENLDDLVLYFRHRL